MSRSERDPINDLREIPGKGKGLVATRQIPKGMRILSEEAVISVPKISHGCHETITRRQVEQLTAEQNQEFLSMHNNHANDSSISPYEGIVLTNSPPANNDESGIFLRACRINHARDNNAQKNWNANIKRHTVHAMRDIEKDEEITIYYIGILTNRKFWQETLLRKFAFTCACRLCCLPPEQSRESDERLDEILIFDRLIKANHMAFQTAPLRLLRYIDSKVRLYIEHGPGDAGLTWAYFEAAQLMLEHGDLARGKILAARAIAGWTVLEGDDSENVNEVIRVFQNSEKGALYRKKRARWKTAPGDVPQELDSKDFDGWLWKREKPRALGSLASFRDRVAYSSFDSLPDEHEYSPDLYTGELPDFQKGHTVAILYAQYHRFAFSNPGIRQEEPKYLKIFPLSLKDLLTLSDRIQRYSTAKSGTKICHGCGKQAATLMKCAKCSLFWYCNRACQVTGWSEKGHKGDCKLLKDAHLKGLFTLELG